MLWFTRRKESLPVKQRNGWQTEKLQVAVRNDLWKRSHAWPGAAARGSPTGASPREQPGAGLRAGPGGAPSRLQARSVGLGGAGGGSGR